jgi:2-polyprenyl-3-methyl-5-hydroxy-6-metoxy-1,4-benzoquinol methylase
MTSASLASLGVHAIDVESRPACPVCGGGGRVFYEDLEDTLFGAPGRWRLRSCEAPACGTAWLDPAPTEAGIGAAYVNYYTHAVEGIERTGAAAAAFRLLWQVTGLAREREALRLMGVDALPAGRLLDVGCGDGRRFDAFSARGWRVEGQEVDARAAAAARAAGYTVHHGSLVDLRLAAAQFDVITLNHVVEHLHRPAETLTECRRLLRPGGRVVAVTPNVASLGHARFGRAWRGLEPPRHLQVFTPASLRAVAAAAGFGRCEVRSSAANAYTLAAASLGIAARTAGRPLGFVASRLGALRFQWEASRAMRTDADAGDECILTALA